MSRSFAGGVLREIEIIAERLIPLMDDAPLDWEAAIASPALDLRLQLLSFEAWLIEQSKQRDAA